MLAGVKNSYRGFAGRSRFDGLDPAGGSSGFSVGQCPAEGLPFEETSRRPRVLPRYRGRVGRLRGAIPAAADQSFAGRLSIVFAAMMPDVEIVD